MTSEYEIATYASGVLKQLSNQCLIPVIILSQLSRDNVKDPNGKRPPELSDLRGSGALEQDATTVVLLHKVAEVNSVWRSEPPMYFVQETDDERLTDERSSSIAAVNWNLAKNQNGATGEIPFVVFQNCLRWYIGDQKGEKAAQYQRITADWRFMEEPFVTAEKKGAVVYPLYWPQKCAEMCGKLGVGIPDRIKEQLSKWDMERYEKLLAEHGKRMNEVAAKAAEPIAETEEPPPSVTSIATEFAEMPKPKQETENKTIQHNVVETNSTAEELDSRLTANTENNDSAEPSFEDEFEDVDF